MMSRSRSPSTSRFRVGDDDAAANNHDHQSSPPRHARFDEAALTATNSSSRGKQASTTANAAKKSSSKRPNGHRSVWQLIALTVSMGGSQIAWVVELGYGTPYLLSLGLSPELTSLVWLAGPISGLVAQPLIGAISDASLSRYRRRWWIVAATILLVVCTFALAYTDPLSRALGRLFVGEFDPRLSLYTQKAAISIAVTAFYGLDFALNGLQGSLRNLTLDVTPGEQLNAASAWLGRFGHIGNIVGYAIGSLNLAGVPILKLVGGGQFRKICIVSLILLISTVTITCWTAEEQPRERALGEKKSKVSDVAHTIYEAVRHLPKPVRRVCYVQIFAFMGWFPFLFYSTTYVSEVMREELGGREPPVDDATRAGSLALLIYSLTALVAGTVLPWLSARDHRLLKQQIDEEEEENHEGEGGDAEMKRIREMVREWKAEAAREGRALRLPHMPFILRNIWTSALLLYSVLMVSTFFIRRVWQATVMIALVGVCWAVACWVPVAIIMEYLKEVEDRGPNEQGTFARSNKQKNKKDVSGNPTVTAAGGHRRTRSAGGTGRPLANRAFSTPALYRAPEAPDATTMRSDETTNEDHHQENPGIVGADERTPLIRSRSYAEIEGLHTQGSDDDEEVDYGGSKPAGGTIMGIHNLAIVFPQFIIALIASIIFKLAAAAGDDNASRGGRWSASSTGVAWTLRFGGLCTLIGALICRRVAPTKTEKAMRRRWAEMRDESDQHAAAA